ncbi:MAG: sporulation integral membrane protein YtvI [Oscillospiraceae bacterium]|nr:sporulation integral membrane protein YtvI [Oscillospiraceae bacterium]
MSPAMRKFTTFTALFFFIFILFRYLFPLFLPFLLGTCLALAAEPLVRFLCEKIRLPRTVAAGVGVSMSFSFLALVIMLLGAVLLREIRQLSGMLPQLEAAARSGMDSASHWMLALAQKAPEGIGTALTRTAENFFTGGSALLEKLTAWLLSLASGLLGKIPDGALSTGTGIISSFMISAKLPKLKSALFARLPGERLAQLRQLLTRLKSTVGSWLLAQVKLSGVNFLVIAAGFLLLRIPYALLWAFLTALVDAFPVLGTGTVLIPWSLLSFLQGNRGRAFGLLGVYAAAALTRSVLEPRLVGRQLGLDPLATLVALYAGYQLWGLPGMLLTPMLAAAAVQLTNSRGE